VIQLPEMESSPSVLPDMTALLDVIFILLVFMMLTANVAPHLLELDLPQTAAPIESVEPNAITLSISEEGIFSIEQQRHENWLGFTLALKSQIQMQEQLHGNAPQLLVAADKDVALNAFVKLAGWLSEQGHSVTEIIVNDQ